MVPPAGASGYGARVGEGSRRRLRAATRAFAASAKNPAVRRIQLGFAGACTAEWAFTVVLSVLVHGVLASPVMRRLEPSAELTGS